MKGEIEGLTPAKIHAFGTRIIRWIVGGSLVE